LLAGALAATGLVVAATASAGTPPPVRVTAAAKLPKGAKASGATPSSSRVTGAVVLKARDAGRLSQFVASVTNPKSAEYRHYLSAGRYASRFGPSAATVRSVRSALTSRGLTVTGIVDQGTMIQFSAPASTIDSAFHTRLENVRLANGSIRHATSSAVALPSSVAHSVTAVVGLNSLIAPHAINPLLGTNAPSHASSQTAKFAHPTGSPTACPDATKDANEYGGLTDDQIANAYGAFGLYRAGDLGAGQRIGVYELEPFSKSDINTFDTCYFGTSGAAAMAKRLSVIPVDGGQPAGEGSGESLLDIEDVSAMAPGAKIDVYEAPNTSFGGLDVYAQMVDSDADQVITTSWGFCEQAQQTADPGAQETENVLFEQAAAQGQTVFSAAGDTGEDDCNALRPPAPAAGQNPVSVDDPSSQPYVVGVGGTTITNASTSPAQEQVWNDGNNGGGGGGGISESWGMPSWQRAATITGIDLPGSTDYTQANKLEQQFGYPQNFCESTAPAGNRNEPCRLVPDVSAQADEYTGAVTVYAAEFDPYAPDGWITIGGTSSSAPIWAGLLADINASPTCQANPATAKGVGFASPLLYAVASNPASDAASFNDITQGNNDIYGLDNGQVFPARPGYDLASGLGSPRLTDSQGTAGLAYYMCSDAGNAARPSVSGLSPKSGSVAGGETVTIKGSGFESGKSTHVSGVQIGTDVLKSAAWKVTSPTTITATVPPAAQSLPPTPTTDGGGAVQVIVTLKDGWSSAPSAASTFQYVDTSGSSTVPDVTYIGPYAGSESAPSTVTIKGSGFTGATKVTFGGVAATTFKVDNPNQITATPARYSSSTKCAPLPGTGVYAGENATNDMCQVQVRVTGPHGTSAASKILPPPEGPIVVESDGAFAPPGCNCELAPASTEYDYVPTPTVSSISTSGGPADLASENGGTVVTIHGTGLGIQTFDWTDFGPPGQASSQDLNFVYATGTEMQVQAPAEPLTTNVLSVPFSVKTIAGQSNSVSALFAGVPTISSVVNTANAKTLNGVYGGPDTGGTPIAIHGSGFAAQLVPPIQFNDASGTGASTGTQYTFSVVSNSQVNTQTVAENPALVDVQACTVTGCSTASSTEGSTADEFLLYPPGDPQVNSVTPSSGPAAGGTATTIKGQNLGCPVQVYFGNTVAKSFTPGAGLLDCGSTTKLSAKSPAHAAGTVPVSVETAEGYFTGSGRGTTTASFTYK
jgi:hypothetical protein